MNKSKTIVVTVPGMIDDDDLAPLRHRSEVDYREMANIGEADLASLCGGYDYLMLNYDVVKKLSEDFYSSQNVRNLKAIAADITGMDWASPQGALDNGITLLNIPHYSTESVAESVLCEVLLHTRQRHSAYVDQIRDRKIESRQGINLLGRTGAVVGLGSIGIRVAELLAGVGMDVVAWNRTPRAGYRMLSLEELFETAKVICICIKTVKSGPVSNVGMISENLLRRCDNAVIVNLANVDLVDHAAMDRQIQAGRIMGYSVERSAELLESPLASQDVVHMPPSNAWSSEESLLALRKTWVANVIAAIDGRPENVYID